MKSLAVVFALGALVVVVGAAATSRARTPTNTDRASTPDTQPEGERYAMSLGRPVELTQGEKQQLRMLVPGIDADMIPPERTGKIRAVLYGRESDANKRSRIKSLLN